MPIYMDRHNVEGASRHELAVAHEQDLRLQARYGVRFLTYWLDEPQSSAFCLVDAPNATIIGEVHAAAHGNVPNKVIEVETSTVEGFLGRIDHPPADGDFDGVDSAFRAVMFTDLVEFTSTTVRLGDEAAMELLRGHNRLIRTALELHDGREVKHTGDGIMASFPTADGAVACSADIQRAFEHRNASDQTPLLVRVGISWGAPVEDRGDLFGSAVQLAARLCDLAGSAQVLVDREVEGQAGQVFHLRPAGSVEAKGFARPVAVYEVMWRDGAQ